MTVTELLLEGVQLMILGMGTVFLFLGTLIAVITLISRLLHRFDSPPIPTAAETEDPLLPAVVAAAVAQYRRDHPHPTTRR
ncbi:MAG: OadG family protein [Gammaproteobacteria bacterium]|nr:OadG family protein [Gammaproteobacteria bacterium]